MSVNFRPLLASIALLSILFSRSLDAQYRLVPGTGVKVAKVGDDFEDPEWAYRFSLPKSTENLNKRQNTPAGESANDRWYEGVKRGQPDIIKRVTTPPNGLEGSTGSLLLRSLQTGIPNRPSGRMQQDDFICNIHYKLGGAIPASQQPSVVTRVFLPPVDEWENRSGPHFAFRIALDTTKRTKSNSIFSSTKTTRETYWPGFFVEFQSKRGNQKHDYAYLRIRANSRGGEFKGKQITQTGWWTLGLSVTPDGKIHYYAKPGVEDLTEEDWITSQYPYGFRCERFKTMFFNVCNGDNGKTWSTEWIVDDPTLYYVPRKR